MRQAVWQFLRIPPEIREEFWQNSLQKNRLSLLVICIMIFGMELYNMARVLFLSSSGLGTLNNRIYFGMYCSLLLAAALSLALQQLTRRASSGVQWAVQYVSVLFFFLWHICLNAYDLFRDPQAEIGLYYTAVLGLSVFILMPAAPALLMHGSAYALLMALSGRILSGGDRVNITCTAIVALAMSLTNAHHHATVIAQRLEISRMNEKLQSLARRDPLTGLLNKSAFQQCAEPCLRSGEAVLLIADLDDFKSVNDRFGHPCGDFVLKEAAHCVEAAFPDALGLSRIGGDEFAVLLGAADARSLEAAARDLIRRVSRITWHGQSVGAGCSIGGCRAGAGGISYQALYSETDRALYEAKARGKGQFFLTALP